MKAGWLAKSAAHTSSVWGRRPPEVSGFYQGRIQRGAGGEGRTPPFLQKIEKEMKSCSSGQIAFFSPRLRPTFENFGSSHACIMIHSNFRPKGGEGPDPLDPPPPLYPRLISPL